MLQIKNLSFEYQVGTLILDDLHLLVPRGKVVGLLGKNGAGKTTVLKLILGLLPIGKGEIFLQNYSLQRQPLDYKKRISYVSDNHELYNSLTGNEYLNFIADMYDVSSLQREQIYLQLIKDFVVEKYLKQPIKNLSHGTKQKFAIIASLVNDPQLWILDEPMTGLDVEAAFILKKLMQERTKKGDSILFSSHVLDVCEKICDEIAFLKNGKIEKYSNLNSTISDFSLEEFYMEVMGNELS